VPGPREPASGQLPLSLGGDDAQPPELPSRLALPLPADGYAPFDDEAYFFEPWWPGAHATLKYERGQVVLSTEHLADPLIAFPELAEVARQLRADRLIIEGILLALDAQGRPDTTLLRQRLSGGDSAGGSAEGAFVATDLPYLEGQSLARQPFVERRRRLAAILEDSDHCVLSRGVVGEGRMLGRAVASLGLPAISARRLDARWKGGHAGDAWLRLPVVERQPSPSTPFLVLLERLPLRD
jgi:bifunctional non-homologous end joining protein LigD